MPDPDPPTAGRVMPGGMDDGSRPVNPAPEAGTGKPAACSASGREGAPFSGEHAAGTAGCGQADSMDAELARLRSLLVGRELDELARITRQLDEPLEHARALSRVVSEALVIRAGKDASLNAALTPVVEEALRTLLRRRPQDIITLFFPVIGATIRRSVSESIHSILEGFNKSLELSFSLKGLRWRLEALRGGKSFSEVVLLHTLLYRVEQVFLIHSETGLMLAHAVNEGVEAQDADMVSAMLTAIQDFVRDCFARGQEGDLDSLRLGDFTIMVERAPQMYLACAVRGTPPEDFRTTMATNLGLILAETAEALQDFQGDTKPFGGVLRYVQDCLITKTVDEDVPLPFLIRALPALLLAVLLGCASWYGYDRYQRHQAAVAVAAHQAELVALQTARDARLERGVALLRSAPGYVVFDTQRTSDGPWHIFCLKDELARPYADLFAENGYTDHDFIVTPSPYVSYQPELVAVRVREQLRPPETVTLNLERDGLLRLSGTAPGGWILQARQTALSLQGVRAVDSSALHDPLDMRIKELVRAVEAVPILFPLGKTTPAPGEMAKLARACDMLAEIERLATSTGMSVSLIVYGHADAVGNDKRNYEISQERAKTLAALLYARGSSMPIALYGMGAEHADKARVSGEGDQRSRKIELRVRLGLPASVYVE